MLRYVVPITCIGCSALYINARPTYTAHPRYHEEPSEEVAAHVLRRVKGGTVSAQYNPGVRVYPNFVGPSQSHGLLAELQMIKQTYGINLIQATHAAIYRWQMSYLQNPPIVNMLRVTGRPEHAAQKAPPWGYGDTFDESKLPPALQQLANKVRSIPGLHLGALRDVTINYRHSYFFRLDPHIDPALDGESVFIIGLDSDAVLTLCPDKWWKLTQAWNMVRGVLTMEDERDLIKRQNQRSWTPYDLDVLMKKASLVLISGDARWAGCAMFLTLVTLNCLELHVVC